MRSFKEKILASKLAGEFNKKKQIKKWEEILRKENEVASHLNAVDGIYSIISGAGEQEAAIFDRTSQTLIIALRSSDPEVRMRVVQTAVALASHPKFPVLPLILTGLKDMDPEVREEAAMACLKTGNIPAILGAIKSADPAIRKVLAAGLGDNIAGRIQRLNNFKCWIQGRPAVDGATPPAGGTREDFILDRAMEKRMLLQISNLVVAFLKKCRQAGMVEEVLSRALRIQEQSDALQHLSFALIENDRHAEEGIRRLLQGEEED